MSVKIMSEVFERSRTQGNARLVLLALADSCNDDASCWPSIRKLADKANVSEPILKKYLNALIEVGVVSREEREDAFGRQTSNLYTINVERIGSDLITQNVIHHVSSPSRLKSFGGLTAVSRGGVNSSYPEEGVTSVSLSIMNRKNEPSIEPSSEANLTIIENDEDLEKAFPRGNNNGISNEIDSRPPNTSQTVNEVSYAQNSPVKKTRQPKLADDAFIAKLKEANPRVDFDTELRKMDNWLISRPTRKKTRAFVTNWINRVVDKLPEKETRFNDF
jgi:predicted transcriptional regulator